MNSTIQPQRMSPMKQMMAPQITASAEATTLPGISGLVLAILATTVPVTVDMTATGYQESAKHDKERSRFLLTPIVISLDVAKNQYISTPMNEVYRPNSGASRASLA